MPQRPSIVSYQHLRDYTEKFSWIDRKTGLRQIGFNPPKSALKVERHPFFIRYITQSGNVESGHAVCIKVDLRRQQRLIQFVESQEIRRVCDYLVIEVDGTYFVTN